MPQFPRRRTSKRLDAARRKKFNIDSSDEDESSKSSDSSSMEEEEDQSGCSKSTQMIPKDESESSEPLCGVCLRPKTSLDHPLLICTRCKVNVHRVCYGIGECNLRQLSNGWTCDPCQDGNHSPHCEYCPQRCKGVYKRTNTNRYAHVLCVLFTQSMTISQFGKSDVPSLETSLIKCHKKLPCNYCEESDLRFTGARVSCEAGTCKSAYHISCAFDRGLIQGPHNEDQEPESFCERHTQEHLKMRRIMAISKMEADLQLNQGVTHSADDKIIFPLRQNGENSSLESKIQPRRNARARPVTESPFLARILIKRGKEAKYDSSNEESSSDEELRVFPSISDEYQRYMNHREKQINELQEELGAKVDLLARLLYEEEKCNVQLKSIGH
ncbi:hypothetical protein ACOME3_010051 [Neoechinorhynchus agilis]